MQRFCNYCGLEINDDDKYCGNCGNEIKEEIDIEPIINEDIHNGKLGKLVEYVNPDEKILYAGIPDITCEILESIFNPMLPFALVWFLFDMIFITAIVNSKEDIDGFGVWVLFFLFHLMPVWIYLFGIIKGALSIKHSAYIVTDKNIYISYGGFSTKYKTIPFEYIAAISVSHGRIDKYLEVGDIKILFNEIEPENQFVRTKNGNRIIISNIHKHEDVYGIIKRICDNNQGFLQNPMESKDVFYMDKII